MQQMGGNYMEALGDARFVTLSESGLAIVDSERLAEN